MMASVRLNVRLVSYGAPSQAFMQMAEAFE
jgi:hypothetical protein